MRILDLYSRSIHSLYVLGLEPKWYLRHMGPAKELNRGRRNILHKTLASCKAFDTKDMGFTAMARVYRPGQGCGRKERPHWLAGQKNCFAMHCRLAKGHELC